MEPNEEERRHQRQCTFIGKVLAEYTHGTRNYLATIRESAGWLGDLLGQPSEGIEDDRRQFLDVLSTIERQVKILEHTTDHLSRFAQRMGIGSSTFDPADIVQEAVSFFTRFARRNEFSLQSEIGETVSSLFGDPVQVHVLLWVLMNDMVQQVGKGGRVTLRTRSAGQDVLIEVEGYREPEVTAAGVEEGAQYWSIAQEIVADIGGRLERTAPGSDIYRTFVFLPAEQARRAYKT